MHNINGTASQNFVSEIEHITAGYAEYSNLLSSILGFNEPKKRQIKKNTFENTEETKTAFCHFPHS